MIPDADLGDQLHEAVQHIGGHYEAQELAPEEELSLQGETIPADPNVKNFSYAVVDGDVYFRENSIMRKADLSATATGRIKGMVELRTIVQELIDYQLNDYPEDAIAQKQRELNVAYDRFADQYGLINSRANAQAFSEDSSYYLLCSLENVDENGRLESKADMFTKRTIRPERAVTSVDTPAEALAISIGERGRVELPYMSELLGTPGEYEKIRQELHGVIFKDPMTQGGEENGWVTADEYLSGNVREKLRVAELAAASDSAFAVNTEYLKKAQPKDLDASEIDVCLGATSGYNREFYEAHRDMLALRSAAKKAFDAYKKENGSDKKLPRISELNAEYAMLLERKKSSYAEYRKTKSKMQDWLVAQKIVQEILKEDEQKKEQLHEQEVRQEEENRQSSR